MSPDLDPNQPVGSDLARFEFGTYLWVNGYGAIYFSVYELLAWCHVRPHPPVLNRVVPVTTYLSEVVHGPNIGGVANFVKLFLAGDYFLAFGACDFAKKRFGNSCGPLGVGRVPRAWVCRACHCPMESLPARSAVDFRLAARESRV